MPSAAIVSEPLTTSDIDRPWPTVVADPTGRTVAIVPFAQWPQTMFRTFRLRTNPEIVLAFSNNTCGISMGIEGESHGFGGLVRVTAFFPNDSAPRLSRAFRFAREDVLADAPPALKSLAQSMGQRILKAAHSDERLLGAEMRIQPGYEDGDAPRVVLEVTTSMEDAAADAFRNQLFDGVEEDERRLGLRRGTGVVMLHWLVGNGT